MTALVLGSFPYPWAARPLLQWDYIFTNVRCWLTFPVRMDQTSTPATTDFTIRHDSTNVTPTSVAWTDEYTLRVVNNTIGAQPTKVQLDFTYNAGNLRALSLKQWPTWFLFPCTDIN